MDKILEGLRNRHSATSAAALIAVLLWGLQDVTALSQPPEWIYVAAVTGVVGILNHFTNDGSRDE